MSATPTEPGGVRFHLPTPQRIEELRLEDGAVILLRQYGNTDGPRLLLCHGNGLATDMVYPLWGGFRRDCEIVAFDLRNHGWNPVGDISGQNVPQFSRDIDSVRRAAAQRFGDRPTIGVYHSVSALAACLSPSMGACYEGLFLLDPPICRAGATYELMDAASQRAASNVRRRQTRFESLEQCVELLDAFPIYRRAVAGVSDLAARATLRHDKARGGFVLRCPREYEARIIDYVTAYSALVDFAQIRCPVQVLGADPTVPYSFLPSFQIDEIMACDYDFAPETSHMLFVERPRFCADQIVQFLAEKCGFRVDWSGLPEEPTAP